MQIREVYSNVIQISGKLWTITHVYRHIFTLKGASTLWIDVLKSEIDSSHKLFSSIQLNESENRNSNMLYFNNNLHIAQ